MPFRFLARPAFALALIASAVASALPPSSLAHAQTMPAADLVDTAVAAGSFTTLATALDAAGLVDTLKGTGPYTVFAPTDAAFAALLAELGVTKDALLADTALLTKVLTYHVLPARVLKAEIPLNTPISTVQGQTIVINSSLQIIDQRGRSSGIVATDIFNTNGVVHVIDRVLLPS